MANKKFYEDSNFWIGVGSYYLFSWIFAFYPAVVFGVAIACETSEDFYGGPHLWGLIWMLIAYGFLQFVFYAEKYVALILIYLFTLWPFIQLIKFYLPDGPYQDSIYTATVPGFDWWPFW